MWAVFSGTIVNTIAVAAGSLVGLSVGARLPARYQQIVLTALGLVTLTLGMDAAVLRFADTVSQYAPQVGAGSTYGARVAMVMITALVVGAVIGTALRLHERTEALGDWIHGRFSTGGGSMDSGGSRNFSEGFLTASVIFCVGPLTLLGCLENGAHGDPSLLYIKSLLDAFCSLALACTLGWGVFASIATIVTFQGGLSLLAYWVAEPLDGLSLSLMTCVGGVILLASALMMLDIKKIPVANLLPGIFLPPLLVWLVEFVHPGLLLPPATAAL